MTSVEADVIALHPEFPALTNMSIWKTEGFLLVYSVTSRSSFEALDDFIRWTREIKGLGACFGLVGNKCDLADKREVSTQEGRDLAHTLGCDFHETSAKTALNVERAFGSVLKMAQMYKESLIGP
ncbi:small GTPase superfamily, partial [Coprinopsis sp. MPI-PUGE-AT-0042]